MTTDPPAWAEELARVFHDSYERLALEFGYETRRDSAVPWEQVPETNRRLMVATVAAAAGPLASEVATLRAAITEALAELDGAHQPMWVSDEAKAAGKEPWVCQTCGVADGGWPCVSRMVADDLRIALGEVPDDH